MNVADDQKEKSMAGGYLKFHNWWRYAQNMIEWWKKNAICRRKSDRQIATKRAPKQAKSNRFSQRICVSFHWIIHEFIPLSPFVVYISFATRCCFRCAFLRKFCKTETHDYEYLLRWQSHKEHIIFCFLQKHSFDHYTKKKIYFYI